jgi:hypothetical protein
MDHLEARWKAIASKADGIIAEWRTGKPMVRYRREAAVEISRISRAVNAIELIETVLAMYVMQDQEPRRFKSEAAFRAQLVRRVRGLTALNADIWTDPQTGRKKRVYRDLAPKTVALIGQWLAEALGVAGLHFATLERRDHERAQQELQAFHETLDGLQ